MADDRPDDPRSEDDEAAVSSRNGGDVTPGWLGRLNELTSREIQLATLLLSTLFVGYLFYRNTHEASRLIDGVRWYWLDDDQMISMRYARNLAHGHGLVWNVGERVEGYTNFLWTLVMAVVHLAGVSDQQASLPIVAINFGLIVATVWLSMRLLRVFVSEPRASLLVTVACVVTSIDVMYWAENGHETALVGVLQLLFLCELLENKRPLVRYVALALIPLVRGDGMHIFVGNAALALYLAEDRRRTLWWLAAAFAPTALHFVFRYLYYGDWLPNTYYLKSQGLPNKHMRGARYARNFLFRYGVATCFGLGTVYVLAKRDRRVAALITTVGATAGYCVVVGGDNFPNFRFFAHTVPVVFVFAAAGAVHVAKRGTGQVVWYAALLMASLPLHRPIQTLSTPSPNGDPFEQIVAAALLRKNASPDASVAVIPAGIVPYFSRLKSLDVLGKSDPHIAHEPYRKGGKPAHGKLDPEYTLSLQPDWVVSCRPAEVVAEAPKRLPADAPWGDYVLSFLATPSFRQRYLPYPTPDPFLARHTQIYTYAGSPEVAKRASWQRVTVEK